MLFWQKGLMALCCFCLLPSSLFADTEDKVIKKTDEQEFSWWQAAHQSASKTVAIWSSGIDTALSGKASSTPDDSQVKIRFGPIINEDSVSGFFDFKARLKLPNTQDRLRLVIESDGDSLLQENVLRESSESGDVVDSALGSRVSAAVRYIKTQWGAEFDAGILVDFPLDPFFRFRFRQGNEDAEEWRWWQQEEAFAYYSKGVGARYSLGVSHQVNATFGYGSDLGVTWLDGDGLLYSRENFFVQHMVDEQNRFRYQLSFLQSGASKLQADSFLYYVEYEHLLHKNWLIGKVKPQMTYEADKDYRAEPSLTLSLEILLGHRYLH
ncbi:hypothetical protein [Marinomonas transparens]|uniref:DUF481 domain-containing protein n=1 Tax=Marinomonas transparens TaxID=2795388 RepID=A0A934N4Z4_9GAMM|nr:hypothetical protein [Marinomonas transparens]MBJ7536516.1 hypothetical protein [Marinomonas transparens]